MNAQLVNSSIVVLVRNPSPTTFSASFLREKVWPDRTNFRSQVYIPPLAQYVFDDGLILEAVESRVKVEKNRSPQKKSEDTEEQFLYSLVDTASPLFAAVSYMEPFAIGLNYRFELKGVSSLSVFRGQLPEDAIVRQVVVRRPFSAWVTNLHFGVKDGSDDAVFCDANVHIEPASVEPGERLAWLEGGLRELTRKYDHVIEEIANAGLD